MSGTGKVNSVVRAIQILQVLGDASDDLTLSQIAERSELPKSTVHRIVQTLRSANFVHSSSAGGLRLGPELARLASISRIKLVPIVRPFLEGLSRKLNQGASLAVLDGPDVRFLDQAIATQGLRAVSLVGSLYPAHCTANGKALLAEAQPAVLESTLPRRLERLTEHTITSRTGLINELATIRRVGVAFDREEHSLGISALGRVIHDSVGNLAAITVAMPTGPFVEREEEVERELIATTDRVNNALALASHTLD